MGGTIAIKNVYLSKLSSETYAFTKRVTKKELITACSKKVKAAQDKYKAKLNTAASFWTTNFRKCQEMNLILGDSSYVEDTSSENEDVPEGRKKCSIHDCQVSTYKLNTWNPTL